MSNAAALVERLAQAQTVEAAVAALRDARRMQASDPHGFAQRLWPALGPLLLQNVAELWLPCFAQSQRAELFDAFFQAVAPADALLVLGTALTQSSSSTSSAAAAFDESRTTSSSSSSSSRNSRARTAMASLAASLLADGAVAAAVLDICSDRSAPTTFAAAGGGGKASAPRLSARAQQVLTILVSLPDRMANAFAGRMDAAFVPAAYFATLGAQLAARLPTLLLSPSAATASAATSAATASVATSRATASVATSAATASAFGAVLARFVAAGHARAVLLPLLDSLAKLACGKGSSNGGSVAITLATVRAFVSTALAAFPDRPLEAFFDVALHWANKKQSVEVVSADGGKDNSSSIINNNSNSNSSSTSHSTSHSTSTHTENLLGRPAFVARLLADAAQSSERMAFLLSHRSLLCRWAGEPLAVPLIVAALVLASPLPPSPLGNSSSSDDDNKNNNNNNNTRDEETSAAEEPLVARVLVAVAHVWADAQTVRGCCYEQVLHISRTLLCCLAALPPAWLDRYRSPLSITVLQGTQHYLACAVPATRNLGMATTVALVQCLTPDRPLAFSIEDTADVQRLNAAPALLHSLLKTADSDASICQSLRCSEGHSGGGGDDDIDVADSSTTTATTAPAVSDIQEEDPDELFFADAPQLPTNPTTTSTSTTSTTTTTTTTTTHSVPQRRGFFFEPEAAPSAPASTKQGGSSCSSGLLLGEAKNLKPKIDSSTFVDSDDEVASDNEEEFGPEPQGYVLPEESEAADQAKKAPKYLRDCIKGLQSNQDAEAYEAALRVAAALVQQRPDDLDDLAEEMALTLLRAQNHFSTPGFAQLRSSALVALACACPVFMAACLTREFYDSNYSIIHRLDMLHTMGVAARQLSHTAAAVLPPPPASAASSLTGPAGSQPLSLSVAGQISPHRRHQLQQMEVAAVGGQGVGKTRRFVHGPTRAAAAALPNDFAPVAGLFFFPLLGRYDARCNTFDMLGRDGMVLALLVRTLATMLDSVGPLHAVAQPMAVALLDFVTAVRFHPDIDVRRSCCFALAILGRVASPSLLLQNAPALFDEAARWLQAAVTEDPDPACRELAMAAAVGFANSGRA